MNSSQSQMIKISQPQLMEDAKIALTGKWGLAVGAYLVYMVVVGVVSIIPFGTFLIGGPFALGLAIFSLKIARDQEVELSNIFDGFSHFGTAFIAYVVMALSIGIGMLFLIVPGVILALGLSQSMYIIADDPTISPIDALKESWELMKGNKTDYFVLGLRFIPWMLLCILTLFIGFLWLAPYMQVTFANFYDSIRAAKDPSWNQDEDDISKHLVGE